MTPMLLSARSAVMAHALIGVATGVRHRRPSSRTRDQAADRSSRARTKGTSEPCTMSHPEDVDDAKRADPVPGHCPWQRWILVGHVSQTVLNTLTDQAVTTPLPTEDTLP